eukprot:CAMPEP_0176489490 /NCGR_PEP_ID=MMETSP0200_2-20121128/7317_1 /TAXON_ID=947934 /ORGANISM="Chaetoceros sp., Strain GSL56" /LENGTH=324 /DNA_ID=CAMNT_0017886637 /DNA_START=59 /DNA_END=1030 /DNA_ORIENTATION=+
MIKTIITSRPLLTNINRNISATTATIKVAVSAFVAATFIATAGSCCISSSSTCTSATTNNKYYTKNTTICNGRVPSPPRYGKYIPHYLLGSSVSNKINHARYSSLRSSNNDNKENNSSGGDKDKDKHKCPLCEKYSQGPCGDLFQNWLSCIDSHQGGNEAECDSLIVPLDACLKEHAEYYNTITVNSYLLEGEDEDNTESNHDKRDTVDKWKEFIQELDKEEDINTITDFPKGHGPKMELRAKDQTGFAMFCSRVEDRDLLLAYIQDQDGNVLGAGSVQELYPYQEQENDDKPYSSHYYFVLRFAVPLTKECQSVTAHGLYGYE